MIEQIAAALSLVILAFVLWLAVEIIIYLRTCLYLRDPRTERISEAALTTKLIPRFKAFVTAKSELFIVGGDGAYMQKKRGEDFMRCLEHWLKIGCKISYTLVCPHNESVTVLRRLSARYPSFSLYLLSATCDMAPGLEALIDKYRTFHPVLLQTADGERVMWIEHYHPPDSELAFDIEFIAPEQAARDVRFDEFMKDIQFIKQVCPQEMPSAVTLEAAA
jgi:hypothetical protein